MPQRWRAFIGLGATILLACSFASCDGCAGSSGGSCACETDEDCPEPMHCGGCYCVPDCATNADCTNPLFPNCDPSNGHCIGPCGGEIECPPEWPNCDDSGICFAACAAHEDCVDPALPNCQLDATLDASGMCTPPCTAAADCPSLLYPNCDPSPGICIEPCTLDADCPAEVPRCETTTGLCYVPACVDDTGCDPPTTVCEDWECVPGCQTHADCDAASRCDLITAGHLYHCEPRDCLADSDCNPPIAVCDTDGLAMVDAGGYCLPGCTSHYDCAIGYDCDPSTGGCSAHDYGDIGASCNLGCDSGFCLSGAGNVCTDFCCTQHDCPPEWGCRPYPDGSGGNNMVDVCVVLDATQGDGRYGDTCIADADCRSNECYGSTCLESCCTHGDCGHLPGQACLYINDRSMCTEAGVGLDPLGTPGCASSGSSGDCLSNLCFIYYSFDTCTSNTDCTNPDFPTCHDWNADGTDDCIRDMCIDHCCTQADCPDYGGEQFYCAKRNFGSADFDLCMRISNPGSGVEGDACASRTECRSNFCNGTCRERCCTDADCTNPAFPNCRLEQHTIGTATRFYNVCVP